MSANATTWFYTEPEPNRYYISERLNGTFWQARITDFYWSGKRVEAPFSAEGVNQDGTHVEISWIPGEWLSLAAPEGYDADDLVRAISKRVIGFPAALSYTDAQNRRVYEWHRDGGRARWKEIQGRPSFARPLRLAAR